MSAEQMYIVRPGESRPTRVNLMPLYRVLAGADDTGGRFTLIEVEVYHDVPPHVHGIEAESALLTEGELRFTYDGADFDCGPGSYIYLPPGKAHAVRRLTKTNPRLIQVASPGGFEHFAQEFIEAGQKGLTLKDPEMQEIARKYGWVGIPPEEYEKYGLENWRSLTEDEKK